MLHITLVYRRDRFTADPRHVMQDHEKENRKLASRSSGLVAIRAEPLSPYSEHSECMAATLVGGRR